MTASEENPWTGGDRLSNGHWERVATIWRHIGPPLRPSEQDIAFYREAVQEWTTPRGIPRVLLLGVTPELYHLPWPVGTDLLAVDRTQAMIDAVWPGPMESVQCEDWLKLTLPEASRDIVLCNGGLHLLAYRHGQCRLVRSLGSVLSDRGLCILRLFVAPAQPESPDSVIKDLLEGRIPNMSILKLRLGISLQKTGTEGVALGAIWRAIHDAAPDLKGLASELGWDVAETLAIHTYRDSSALFHFVTLDQVTNMFCVSPGGFEVHQVRRPSYPWGEQFPTIIFQHCSRAPHGRKTARRKRP